MNKTIGYLRLMRPANLVTAVADILMGFAASGALSALSFGSGSLKNDILSDLGLLILSTIGLYGGGVVFNDVFDAELDKMERPERPIPSGLVSKRGAETLGSALLLVGIVAALSVNFYSLIIAIIIALLALAYDAFSKHHTTLGPLNMGACRGGNILLGISIIPPTLPELWYLAFIPILYIGAITLISQGEVRGNNQPGIQKAFITYLLVILFILLLGLLPHFDTWSTIPFLFLFIYIIFPPLIKSYKLPQPYEIRKAVKAGILALIVMNASLAAGFAGWQFGLLVLSLLPVSIFLGKKFAVT